MKRKLIIYLCLFGLCFFACKRIEKGVHITEQLKKTPGIDALLVYAFNDSDSLNLNVVDLNTGKLFKTGKTEKVDRANIYITSKKQGRILEGHNGFKKVFNLDDFEVWSSELKTSRIHITRDNLLFYDAERKALNLNGEEIMLNQAVFESIPQHQLSGDLNEYINRGLVYVRFLNDQIYLLNKDVADRTILFRLNKLKEHIEVIELKIDVSDALTGYGDSKNLYFYGRNGYLYRHNLENENTVLFKNLKYCNFIEIKNIGHGNYVYTEYGAPKMAGRSYQDLYLVNTNTNEKEAILTKYLEYEDWSFLSYGIFSK
jgi:hypothetical protein